MTPNRPKSPGPLARLFVVRGATQLPLPAKLAVDTGERLILEADSGDVIVAYVVDGGDTRWLQLGCAANVNTRFATVRRPRARVAS